MARKNIVLVTDCTDVAIEQVKARLTKILSERGIEPNFFHAFVRPFQINSGAFLSKLIAEEILMGEDTLFLAIVNPLKIKPKRIFGQLKNGTWFVCADTGIFSLLFNEFGIKEVFEGKNQEHYPFGGLHVHTVTAGKLLIGIPLEELGNLTGQEKIRFTEISTGEVVYIDNFGLTKIWMKSKDLTFKEESKVSVKVKKISGEIKTFPGIYTHRMMDYPDNTLCVYPGSSLLEKDQVGNLEIFRRSGVIELGLVRNPNTAKELGIDVGDIVEIENIQ